jgi:hypothetical protein
MFSTPTYIPLEKRSPLIINRLAVIQMKGEPLEQAVTPRKSEPSDLAVVLPKPAVKDQPSVLAEPSYKPAVAPEQTVFRASRQGKRKTLAVSSKGFPRVSRVVYTLVIQTGPMP